MPRRRIAVVTDWYPSPERPIAGTFVAEQARAAATRHDVAVVVSPSEGSPIQRPYEVSESRELGLRTLRVRYRRSRVPKLAFVLRLAGTLAALRRVEPEVVHAHVFGPGLVAVLLGRLLRRPVVVSEHFSGIARGTVGRGDRAIARFVYRRADAVCPVSGNLLRQIDGLAPGARLRLVPNPVDTTLFRPGERPAGRTRALAVAALTDAKGIPELLEALAEVRSRREVELDVVGDGPGRDRYETRARELGLGEAVRFYGILPRERVGEAMRASAFLVHPSHWENLPGVVVEALASGLPVVSTTAGGIPELVGPDEGILVPPGDAAALARAVEEMCERHGEFDPERLSREAASHFGFEAVAERWTEVYEEVLASA
jgi:glycosyltransferase involved in cell wall biosynthesis